MRFSIVSPNNRHPYAAFDDEPEPRSWLLQSLLMDCDGQEDYYLSELARGEAGEHISNLYNHYVHVYPYRDVVVIEDMYDRSLGDDEEAEGPPSSTFLSPAEARQLILDWRDAKERWYAERRRAVAN